MKKKKLLAMVLALLCFVTTFGVFEQKTEAATSGEKVKLSSSTEDLGYGYTSWEAAEKDYPILKKLKTDSQLTKTLSFFPLGKYFTPNNNNPANSNLSTNSYLSVNTRGEKTITCYYGQRCYGYAKHFFYQTYYKDEGYPNVIQKNYGTANAQDFRKLFCDFPTGVQINFGNKHSEVFLMYDDSTETVFTIAGNILYYVEESKGSGNYNIEHLSENRVLLCVRTMNQFMKQKNKFPDNLILTLYKCNIGTHKYLFSSNLQCFVCSNCGGRSYCYKDYEGRTRKIVSPKTTSSSTRMICKD